MKSPRKSERRLRLRRQFNHLDLAKRDERRVQRRLVDAVREPPDVERGLGTLALARRGAADERGLHAPWKKGDRAERERQRERKKKKEEKEE